MNLSVNVPEAPAPVAHDPRAEPNLSPGQWGMVSFLLSEAVLFCTLIVVYFFYLGQDRVGPTPKEALSLPFAAVFTFFLLSSSVTIHRAEAAWHASRRGAFLGWWTLTVLLGALFLVGTGLEWHDLIVHQQLTLGRNLFGTTYFTLVGLHAAHVSLGLGLLLYFLVRQWGQPEPLSGESVMLASWYWHFVDAVWIVVFIVVYVIGR